MNPVGHLHAPEPRTAEPRTAEPGTADPGTPVPTSPHTSGVNYHATSRRIRFEDLSPAVREAAELALGSPVVRAAAPVTSGFSNAYAGHVLLRDGHEAFLKAAGPGHAYPVLALAREAQVLGTLGSQVLAVPMIGAGASSDGGQVLALDWVEGRMPGFPWTTDEIALVRAACERVAALPPSSMDGLAPGRLADDLLDDQRLRAALTTGLPLPRSLTLLPTWLPARIDDVLAVAGDIDALRAGDQQDHLNHFDLRPDNLLIGRGDGETYDRAYLLDWNWVTLGPAWCDWVGLIPSMQAQGHDLGELLDSTPLSRTADPHAVDVFLALIAVYMLSGLETEPPAGATMALRDHQRYYARLFLDTLAAHEGWR
jgi:hypothetical protein